MSDSQRRVYDIDEFVKLVADSRLVEAGVLPGLIGEFEADVLRASPFGNTITGLSNFLISKRVLTCWQVDKLRQGKYKGFFYFGYRLLDIIGDAVLLAENEKTSQLVAIEIPPARDGKEVPPRVIHVYEN